MISIKGEAIEGYDRGNSRNIKFIIVETPDNKHIGHIGFADGCMDNNFWTEKIYCITCQKLIGEYNKYNQQVNLELQFPKGFKESVIQENIFELTAVV